MCDWPTSARIPNLEVDGCAATSTAADDPYGWDLGDQSVSAIEIRKAENLTKNFLLGRRHRSRILGDSPHIWTLARAAAERTHVRTPVRAVKIGE